jgi:hypothetical protein
MRFVQWSRLIPSKVHIAASRLKTWCAESIPSDATATATPPKDKTTLCKVCRQIEQEQKRYQHLIG